MQFIETLNALDLPTIILETTHKLLEQKAKTSEMGKGPKIPVLEDFIQEQLKVAQKYCESAPVGHIAMNALNKLFRQTINESWEN